MEAYHNSRDIEFRAPFGAVKAGTKLKLRIDIWNGTPEEATLRVWTDGVGETRQLMDINARDGGYTATAVFEAPRSALCWYRFEIKDADGSLYYYGRDEKHGGVGKMYPAAEGDCPSYQITVYKERIVPDWYKQGIVYQIFPDRFAGEAGSDEDIVESRISGHAHGPLRRAVSWEKPVSYEKNADKSIAAWDFYGGSLKGIEQKLDYLKELGVSIIYLNPIFEAASNHRYDTGDYMSIDPVLGDEADLERLCKKAREKGISVILDGVFNHTGCDSIYFNKYGNYEGLGAYQSEESPYREWYSFNNDSKDGYDSWWGVGDLPNLREESVSLRELIYASEDSVVRHYMKLGARGWRLDVADELPDDFIAGIKQAMTDETGDDALLMGEVWEDASNKESYGVRRRYFQGEELDCVMNYPFRDGVCAFLTGKSDAGDFAESMYTLSENYPKEAFYSSLNLIGSHDKARILTVLSGAPEESELSEDEKKEYRLSEAQRGLGKSRLWLAALMQMTMPGVPSVYYGDEIGMEGYSDPYNRASYPWGGGDNDCKNIYINAIGIRRSHKVFTEGDFKPFAVGKDVIGYTRQLGNEAVTVLINRSNEAEHSVKLLRLNSYVSDLISGKLYADGEEYEAEGTSDEEIEVKLGRLGSAIIYFAPKQRLGKLLTGGRGVLCHITSLPNSDKGRLGVIGDECKAFIDKLKIHGDRYWQILPLGPTDPLGSPYAGSSAFAGNIDLLPFTAKELDNRYKEYRKAVGGRILPAEQYTGQEASSDPYIAFIKENAAWIDIYAMYMAVQKLRSDNKLKSVSGKYASYTKELWADKRLAGAADSIRYAQYIFDISWNEIRQYAAKAGISIIGDMPIYVSADSADAWGHPEYFTISESEAGVPPDYFSEEGQSWGNPLYRWDKLKEDGYSFWIDRFKRAFRLYDIVRLDHFRGFEAYWEIPKGRKAKDGHWMPGPGKELFEKAYEQLGPLPVIAEDLGYLTPGVRALTATTGFPGMDVMQFYNGDPAFAYEPDEDRVSYTGTHDNETLLGWCINRCKAENIHKAKADGCENELSLSKEASELRDRLIDNFYKSDAFIKILPLQDLLGLDNTARMNVPGTIYGNWRWQAEAPVEWEIRKDIG